MKPRFSKIGLMLLISCSVTLAAGTAWISADGPTMESPVTATVTNRTPTSLDVTIIFPGIMIEDMDTPHGAFTRITADGAGVTTEIGSPELPVVRFLLWIPEGGNPTLDILSQQTANISLSSRDITAPVYPVQAPVEKVPGALEKAEFRINAGVYAANSYQFAQIATLGKPGYMRGYRQVGVEVRPVDCNPVANEVRITSRLVLKVTVPDADLSATNSLLSRYNTLPYQQVARSIFLNGDEIDDIPDLPIGYLIICDDIYQSDPNLLGFVDWKHSIGYDVTLVPTTVTGTTTTQIKTYIQNAYNTWVIPPTYVLLIGDNEDIPSWVGIGPDNPPTDLNYAMLAGSDYFPDVYLGRWAVITPTQLGYIIAKTNNFEQVLWSGNDTWEKWITFMASNDNYTVSEGTHNYVINTFLIPLGYQYDRLYCHTYSATPAQVSAALNAGRSIMTYSGHGAETYWADGPVFYQSDIRNSVNTVYPVVHSFSCLTGNFNVSECFGETWIRDDHGAAAYHGSSVTSYWNEDDILERRMYQGMFDNQNPGDLYNLTWVAGMFDYGKLKLYEYYGNTSTIRRYFEMYNLLGDPSLDIWTNVPVVLTVSHPSTVMIGEPSLAVSVSNTPTWALICARTETADNLFETAYLHGSGSVNLDISSLTMPGTLYLTITGHDIEPYTAEIQVVTSGPDIWPPAISHTPLPNTLDQVGPYVVTATITDYSGVASATLYHGIDGTTFTPVAMTNTTGNTWTGNIPGRPAGTTVYYYIEATDASPNSNVGQTDTYSFDVLGIIFSDDMETGQGDWTHAAVTPGWTDQWHISTEMSHSVSHAWKFGDTGTSTYANHADGGLISPTITVGNDAELTFWHWIDAEVSTAYPDSAYDGGVVDISVNEGPWLQLTTSPGTNKIIRYTSGGGNPYTGPFPGGTHCFSGAFAWTQETADLSSYEGDIRLRFRFGSDNGGAREGWYLDDIQIIGTPPGGIPPARVDDLVIVVMNGNVYLSWSLTGAPGYNVYSDTDPHGAFSTLETTTAVPAVVLPGQGSGMCKYYIVRSTDNP